MIIKKIYLIALLIPLAINGCKQKAINNAEILNDLKEYYYANQTGFDSLAVKLSDTAIGNSEISFTASRLKIKKNTKGYQHLYFKDWGTSPEKRTFGVKELGYGIDCGFYYLINEERDYFENPRLIFKRIDGNWFSYIYFN